MVGSEASLSGVLSRRPVAAVASDGIHL